MSGPTIPEGYLADSRGRLVPADSIKPVDLERDALVREIVARGKELATLLADFRIRTHADIEAFCELSAEKYGAQIGGKKGNISLVTFDGRYKVMRAINDQLVFDERLQAAKALIDDCLNEWTADSRKEVRTLINDAFAVDKEGKISTARVLSLRRLDFDDPQWKRAMEAISDSLSVAISRSYIRLYERDAGGAYHQISLDLANA